MLKKNETLSKKERSIEKKEDGRVVYTKMRIRSAYYELLQEMDAEKVTVTAICKQAEINRATFYKHYLDVEDLKDKLQEEAIKSLSKGMDDCNASATDLITNILTFLKKDAEFHPVVNSFSDTTSSFSKKISMMIYENFSKYLDPKLPNMSPEEKGLIFAYVAAGSAGIIDYWMNTNCKEKEEVIAEKIQRLTSSTIQNLSLK
ncbi:MAG: TetR/AcrR family transcriptional regulator [Lachnospiraceae bacterium]|nr:TetR/AcrR family transcriptional regulator [Lachnospiraceae bacterium]